MRNGFEDIGGVLMRKSRSKRGDVSYTSADGSLRVGSCRFGRSFYAVVNGAPLQSEKLKLVLRFPSPRAAVLAAQRVASRGVKC